jgi:diguanylate cyclase (GGDEF)-like protein
VEESLPQAAAGARGNRVALDCERRGRALGLIEAAPSAMPPQPLQHPRLIRGYPRRLVAYTAATIAVAAPILAVAVVGAISSHRRETIAGAALFVVLAVLAELKPVPVDEEGKRLVSLAFIFIVSSQIIFGWEQGVIAGTAALAVAQIADPTTGLRAAFNTAVYVVAALAASVPWFVFVGAADPIGERNFGLLTAISFAEGFIFVGLNVTLVCFAIALYEGISVRGVLSDHLRHSGPAFGIMGFIAALTVALWSVWQPLVVLLAGPLFALTLFQRYALRTKVALREAATDSLTGLKNHRAYDSAIVEESRRARASGAELALCLIDIDDFKQINDIHGHPVGDEMLRVFGTELGRLEGPIDAYRLGGDEFALVIRGGEDVAVRAIETLRARLAEGDLQHPITFSAGIGCYPRSAEDVKELRRVADVALYQVKRTGKNRARVYDGNLLELSWSAELAATIEYDARLRAVGNLIRIVDARDTYTGSHSQSVSVLVEGIGHTLGLSEAGIAQLRLAGLLHDLGKIAVPDAILQKPGRLQTDEAAALRQHPVIAFELLQGLDVDPVDLWILHHHEHWDGSGYPHGLRGEEIPIGSRVILVADAFDAMTSERCYREAIPVPDALGELRAMSGRQFDPSVVGALETWLARYALTAA